MNSSFSRSIALAGILVLIGVRASAHLIGDADHDHEADSESVSRAPSNPEQAVLQPRAVLHLAAVAGSSPGGALIETQQALRERMEAVFRPFLPGVRTRFDDRFLYVESESMPDHRMMVGITAWQQQVPLPQRYLGANAWRIPILPVVATNPISARTHFFRGAIALAANGVPIFNPIKNDGRTDTFLAGELDEFGGHCGRADDYHYHIAPTHLQDKVGRGLPIAFALDGYPIYGFVDPDGSTPGDLDDFNGHRTAALGYHYHATRTYPYLNGGFHGQVVERDGQVDPQPRAVGVRPALPPWRGARIAGFESREGGGYHLEVRVGEKQHFVDYTVTPEGGATFRFTNPEGQVRTESYPGRSNQGAGPRGPRRANRDVAD